LAAISVTICTVEEMSQIRRKEVIPDDAIPVVWAARGEHVYSTPLSEFEEKVREAKEKEESRYGYLGYMQGKRYAR